MQKKIEAASQGSATQKGASETTGLSLSADETAEAIHDFTRYADDPAGFARDILRSTWWQAQTEIAALVAANRRVAVKAANGVGKTYLAADLVLWFLYCHRPSVVLTTAPTWRQVESLLWEEVRRRHHAVNALAESDPTRPKLEGSLLQTRLKIAEGWFAMGLSTDEPVRFQGFHAENLLVVLDEACGVPEEIWDAVEGVCVGDNNRVLAISNPLTPSGRFYGLFKSPRWKTYTISALVHPNVTGSGCQVSGIGENGSCPTPETQNPSPVVHIPGAVTREAVADRLADWCETEAEDAEADADTFVWEGKRYRPNGLFRSRVLGEFPQSAEDSLIAIGWIEKAMRLGVGDWVLGAGEKQGSGFGCQGLGNTPSPQNLTPNTQSPIPETCILAVDVARYGGDETVLALRRGNAVTKIRTFRGLSTMEVAGQVKAMAEAEQARLVTVDVVGVGAGVVDRLEELGMRGLVPANFGTRPFATRDADHFLNLRAQTYWALRERLRQETICLPKDDTLATQLAGLRYTYTSLGQIQIESKDDMRKRGLTSPDRADAVAMLFSPLVEAGDFCGATPRPLLPASERAVPVHWDEETVW